MNNSLKIKRLVGVASLAAIIVVLQFLSGYITFGPFNITLALIPLAVGSIIYGPKGGLALGLIMGLFILLFQSQAFLAINPFYTAIIVFTKTGVAGLVAGLIFKALGKKHFVLGIVLASISVPIINTGLFALGCLTFFYDTLVEWGGGQNGFVYLITGIIGFNFIIEFIVNSALSPVVIYLIRILDKRNNLLGLNPENNLE